MGLGSDGSKEQKRYNREQARKEAEQKRRQQQAVASIYRTFGLDARGNPVENSPNHTQWSENLDRVYDDVTAVHTDTLNTQRHDVTDALMAQLLRQGMVGSHLTDQYEYQVDDAYQRGLAQIDSVAAGARSNAKSRMSSIMNDAIAQVNAGNLDAASAGSLRADIGNAMTNASATATSQQINGLFDDVLRAYELRRENKGRQLAEQSYHSTAGHNGTITGGP
ncbi:hypothetical protein [Microbulbifer sp. TYP-18]|uniref:hypothetical protein n=1 Tax=Microbulbifer sp. TYP-18 TaxID=3230024 RepID=UPI0034C5BEE7